MDMRRYQKHLAKLKSRSHIHATVKISERLAMRALLKIFFGYAPCRPDERVPPIGAQDNITSWLRASRETWQARALAGAKNR